MSHHHHQLSLAERQRQILEKGLKRRPQREDRYENDSASGEDPLMGGSSAPLAGQQPQPQQQQRLSKQARVGGPGLSSSSVRPPAVPRVVPRARTPVKASPQRSVAVVLASTPKKDREEFVVVKADELRDEPMKAVNGRSTSQPGPAAQPSTEEPERMKRRGRPKGWKPGMAYTDLRPRPNKPNNTSNTTATGQKRRGRPPKPASPPPKQLYHQFEAGFFAFLCEWKGCQAELHNLATLRRHVHTVHGEEGSDQGCKWGPCATSTSTSTSTSTPARQEMIGRKFRKHIEEQHLIPLSWHVGDGPRHQGDGIQAPTANQVGGEEDRVPRWLKDDEGRQVTQGIWEQEIEDLKTWKERRRRLKELLVRRDENLQSEEEEGGGEGQEGK